MEHEIIRDHTTKRSRGFGFIVFDNEKVVDNILADGNMIDMAGTQVSSPWFFGVFDVFGTSNANGRYKEFVIYSSFKGCICETFNDSCYLLLPNNNIMSFFISMLLLLLDSSYK